MFADKTQKNLTGEIRSEVKENETRKFLNYISANFVCELGWKTSILLSDEIYGFQFSYMIPFVIGDGEGEREGENGFKWFYSGFEILCKKI